MATDKPTSSFGIELEFLVAVKRNPPSPARKPLRFLGARGAPIVVDGGGNAHGVSVPAAVRANIKRTIRLAAERCAGDRVVSSEAEATADPEAIHLRPYAEGWQVKDDMSVKMPPELLREEHMQEYIWQRAEITSPPLWATEKSYNEVRAVVWALSDAYWVLAPAETAGLHVHYGRGRDWIPFHELRRIAAFLYPADPILVQMHPPPRRETAFAASNRLYSQLAHWVTPEQAAALIRNPDLEEVPPWADGSGPQTRPLPAPAPFFPPLFRRGALGGYTFSEHVFGLGRDPMLDQGRQTPLGTEAGARALLAAPNAPTVALLMQFFMNRAAYNFGAYNSGTYRRVWPGPSGPGGELLPDPYNQPRRTLEFRQAASTDDADEVVAHCRVVVRICEWAGRSRPRDFWKIVLDCAQAETHPGWYDVFDLLADLGLADEARVLQRRLARSYGVQTPDRGRAPGWRRASSVPPTRTWTSLPSRVLRSFRYMVV
ncbi:putative amidoligase enzyme-domain-containing protein [Durotheca rogersii]|uniref:putative amidoligase enzyme-domain-containing protein n=1 Tax=Durotheca rogersii TaxID=419775 RepID=UPI00221ECE77|nr:putative amidoligase enzyme-domain-containing protein [Durotheca rogersii]KAI5863920.1 putative amidoligase enzyme-domain-containing protein [Durotheca rogersii]